MVMNGQIIRLMGCTNSKLKRNYVAGEGKKYLVFILKDQFCEKSFLFNNS